jgi:hypothetical protein
MTRPSLTAEYARNIATRTRATPAPRGYDLVPGQDPVVPIDRNNAYRIAMIVMAVIITGLAVAGAMTLIAASHDQPLHRAYACAFHKDLSREDHLPTTPCTTVP